MDKAAPRTSRVQLKHGRAHLYERLARSCQPRDRLTVSGWADRYRWLSSKQGGEPGRWQTSRNPVLREIMDCLSATSPVREVVVMKSSQVGVTEATVNWLGYIMEHAPAPAMVLMPTLESRDSWNVQKLKPLIAETEVIRALLGGLRSRDAANRADLIDFPGGILFLAGGNSPNSYAQKSVRYLVLDDLDRFPGEVGEEGDPVVLARGRTKSFARSKLMLISTPTVKGASLIEREYDLTDQRRYHVPCPACGKRQALAWCNLKWNTWRTAVWYECEHCGHHIEEHHKPRMLSEGRWVAEKPEVKRRGYHISALYAPIGLGPSWSDLVDEFLLAKGDPGTLKAFVNTNLGESWEDQKSALKPHELAKRMEDIPMRTIPVGCLALTVGVDTQDQWLAVTMLGHGANHLWVIDYHEISGNTVLDETWDRLEEYLHTPVVNTFGRQIRISAAGIDSRGHRTEQVRRFVARRSLRMRVYATQGSTSRMNRPIAQNASHPDKTARGKVMHGGYGVWNIGTEHCKDYILERLAADSEFGPQDRVIRFPSGLDDAYFDGLLSEYYDPEKKRYFPKKGARWKRNEPLDTFVIAWAVAHHRQVSLGRYRNGRMDPGYWDRLEAVLESQERMEERLAAKAESGASPDADVPRETTPATETRRQHAPQPRGGRPLIR